MIAIRNILWESSIRRHRHASGRTEADYGIDRLRPYQRIRLNDPAKVNAILDEFLRATHRRYFPMEICSRHFC